MKRSRTHGGLLAPLLVFAGLAFAHDMARSESRAEVHGREVRVELRLNLLEIGGVDANGDGSVSYDELERVIDRIYPEIRSHYVLGVPEPPVEVKLTRYGITEGHVLALDLRYTFPHDVTQLQVSSTLDKILQPGHEHLITVNFDGDLHEGVLNAASPVRVFKSGNDWRKTLTAFVSLGVEHIFTGYDHLAFLVGLLIVTKTLGSMIKVITSFTIAHSITLALATFDLVILPSRLTESLIALSIAWVAAENLLGVRAIKRYRITFLFGLIHGFGFSNVLREMGLSRSHLALSLFSFNAGVEIGQVVFALVAFPLVLYLAKSQWRRQIAAGVSTVILCLAVYWFVRRAFPL